MTDALARRGVKRFRFDGWPGPAFPVWYFRPVGAPRDARVLFVLHGVRRDADRYLGDWLDLAERERVVIIVPEFTRAAFPGARGYNHGAILNADGTENPRERWSFSVLEPVFQAVVDREHLAAPGYDLYGHSAGAQFVHRFILTGGSPRLRHAIAANAGSYAMPDPNADWPFGMKGLPADAWNPARGFAQPLVLLFGTADNDPAHPSLPDDPPAVAQGPHRLARGQHFYGFSRDAARRARLPFRWQCGLVPGVGHVDGQMAPYAMAIVTGRVRLTDGADCAPTRLN